MDPHEPTLLELASQLSRLRERVEDLEDLRDLLAAEQAAQGRPGIPWEQVKKGQQLICLTTVDKNSIRPR